MAGLGTVGLAGCTVEIDGASDGGGGGSDADASGDGRSSGSDSAGDTPSGGDGGSGDVTATPGSADGNGGAVESRGESTVDGLEITAMEPDTGGDQFSVAVTILNTGDQQTSIFEYEYGLTLYDANGNDVTGGGTSYGSTNDLDVAPGESATIGVSSPVDGDVADVARFEVRLTCEGMFVEGVYCES